MKNKIEPGFYVYILKCIDESYYTGYTENLLARLKSHSLGLENRYTSLRRPFELVFYSKFPTRYDALDAEKNIKGWSRKKKEALINGDFLLLRVLSKNTFSKLLTLKYLS